MKVYISLPVTSREEKTLQEQVQAARKRAEFLKGYLDNFKEFEGSEYVSVFDLEDYDENLTEAEILGRCVTAVLDCDAIFLDFGWNYSKGCSLEFRAATIYNKKIYKQY